MKSLSKKTKITIVVVLLILYFVILYFHFSAEWYKTRVLGDYGITIILPVSFREKDDTKDLLTAYDSKNQINFNAKELKGDFWSSDDMNVIMDEYVRLLSAMNYDCNIKDVMLEKINVDKNEVGLVGVTLEKFGTTERVSTVLTHKKNGFVAIEIFGHIDQVKNNKKMINDIINSIKFIENTHDYSKDGEIGRSDISSGDIDVSGEQLEPKTVLP